MAWWDDVQGGASGSSGASGGAGGYDPFGNVSGGAGGNSSAGGNATGYYDPFANVASGVGSFGIMETLLNPRNPFDELSGGANGARPPNAGFNYAPILIIGVVAVIAIVVLKK